MAKKNDDDKLFAFLGAFLTIIGFIVVYLTKKDSKYAMYYAKQGLVVGIAWFAVAIVSAFLAWIPVIGWLISSLAWLLVVILWFISWINALSDKMKPTPIIGQWADKFNL